MNVKEKFEKIIFDIEDLVQNDLKKASDISEQIATNMLMDYRELNDVFKFFADRSLNEYIKERKMMAAYMFILTRDEMNIDQAIEISGLDNQSSFGKKFKEVFGITPQEAFAQKDQSKLLSPLSWESIQFIESETNGTPPSDYDSTNYYGVTSEQYNKIIQAKEYQALYDFNDNQSLTAFQIAEMENVSLKEAYAFVEDYLRYQEYISTKYDENKALKFLLSLSSKKIKKIYFSSVAESISEVMNIIETAKENNYSLTKKRIEYLSVYCKDPYSDFDEFLYHVKKFEELNGDDFEEYWEMIYVWGFSPEDAVKGFNDSLDECMAVGDYLYECMDLEDLDLFCDRN